MSIILQDASRDMKNIADSLSREPDKTSYIQTSVIVLLDVAGNVEKLLKLSVIHMLMNN
jgi:hypothetical protein